MDSLLVYENLILIAALGPSRAIGKDGQLPWKHPQEYQHFLSLIDGHTCIMSRSNYKNHKDDPQIKKFLLVGQRVGFDSSLNQHVHSIESTLKIVAAQPKEKFFVLGGSMIYQKLLPHAGHFYLSKMNVACDDADRFFPEYENLNWMITEKVTHDNGPFSWEFNILKRS